jgi:chromosome segregation ATPase
LYLLVGVLEKSQDDLRELLNKKDKILEDLEVEFYSVAKSLTDSQNSKSELQSLIQNTADTVSNLEIQNSQLKDALNNAESEVIRNSGAGTGELIAIRAELDAKNDMIDILRGEISDVQASLHSFKSTISSMERQRSELLSQKEELHVLIRQGQEFSSSQTKLFEEEKKTLRNQLAQIQQSSKQYTTDKIVEIEKLQISIAGKVMDIC